jgi:chorismate mutase/prephenate dehydrogenase
MNEVEEITYHTNLEELRIQLNKVDENLVKMLISRFVLTNEIGKLKQNSSQPIYDPEREKSIFQRIANLIENNHLSGVDVDMLANCIAEVYREIMNQSKISQSHLK